MKPGAPAEDLFKMASSSTSAIFDSKAPLTADGCERVVQVG